MSVERLLARVPGVYDDLVDAAVPSRSGEPPETTDPREKPTPGNLSVMELRHKLVRGLRWWVDAVREQGQHTQVGHDVRKMAEWLAGNLSVMADEDRAELRANLSDWLSEAWCFMGDPEPAKRPLPLEALEAHRAPVRVADAAALLGCTVRTIQRRVPAERRPGGMVLLADAVERCGHCELPVGTCDHTRSATLVVAQ